MTEASGGPKWGSGCVHWKEYATVTLSITVVGGALFGYVMQMHASQPHTGAASVDVVRRLDERLTRQENRNTEALKRIEIKLDNLAKDAHK